MLLSIANFLLSIAHVLSPAGRRQAASDSLHGHSCKWPLKHYRCSSFVEESDLSHLSILDHRLPVIVHLSIFEHQISVRNFISILEHRLHARSKISSYSPTSLPFVALANSATALAAEGRRLSAKAHRGMLLAAQN